MVRKTKVLFFHRTLRLSGAVRQMLQLFYGLDRSRFDPFYVVEGDRRVFDHRIYREARVYQLKQTRDEGYWGLVRNLVRVIDREKPDLVQSFNVGANRMLYLACAGRRHPPLYSSIRNVRLPLSARLSEFLFQGMCRAITVNSEGIRRHLIRDCGIRAERIRLVPNGLDVDHFSPPDDLEREELRQSLGFEADEFVILSVGRVAPQKNLLCTLEAVDRLCQRTGRRIRFVCVGRKGRDDYAAEVSRFVEERGLADRCAFPGMLDDVADHYRAADAMVLASGWEGLPNVLIENMACGGISIVSEASDNDEIVTHDENGFVFRTGDAAHLAGQIERVMALGAGDLRLVAERARKTVEQRFSTERMIRSYEDLWLGRNGRVELAPDL
ncbi:MAG: glycosyltransferase family 4 protein [Proteobacteria bacterium]|nr:glycosyltransferase family 4 protein [Pseudomonadota bacterium]